jgi:RecB family exonuclease
MGEIKLSATRIETFLECKYKYYCSYIERLPKVPSPAFKLGTAVHEALEFAGEIWMKKGKFDKPDKKKIIDKYVTAGIREGMGDMTIFKEGRYLLENKLSRFELGTRIVGLEIKFGFEGTEDVTTKQGVPLMGAIDKVVEFDEETLVIIDYKTSKTAPTSDQLKNNTQLSIYDLVASIKWPKYKRIILGLDLLKHDIAYSYRTVGQRELFEEYLKEVYDQMLAFEKKNAKAQLNIFCPWCDYKEYCSEYKRACKKSDQKFLAATSLPDDEILREWNEVKNIKRILEERERELGMIIVEKIKRFDTNPRYDDKEVYIRQNSRTTYDKKKIASLLDFDDFINVSGGIDKKSIEEYVKRNPALKVRIDKENASSISYTTPFLAVRTIRNGEGDENNAEAEPIESTE